MSTLSLLASLTFAWLAGMASQQLIVELRDYRRFRERGRLAPEGLAYRGSWVTSDLTRCYQVMECDDRVLLDDAELAAGIEQAVHRVDDEAAGRVLDGHDAERVSMAPKVVEDLADIAHELNWSAGKALLGEQMGKAALGAEAGDDGWRGGHGWWGNRGAETKAEEERGREGKLTRGNQPDSGEGAGTSQGRKFHLPHAFHLAASCAPRYLTVPN